MADMLRENRVRTVDQLAAAAVRNGSKWELCICQAGKSRIVALKERCSTGFSKVEQYVAVGERARQEYSQRLESGLEILPGEVVTPIPNTQLVCIYSPLLFDKRDAVSNILNKGKSTFNAKLMENPDGVLPA
jgi:hypothetical protein